MSRFCEEFLFFSLFSASYDVAPHMAMNSVRLAQMILGSGFTVTEGLALATTSLAFPEHDRLILVIGTAQFSSI